MGDNKKTTTHYSHSDQYFLQMNVNTGKVKCDGQTKASLIQNGKIPPGNYIIPYTIQIPVSLPGSKIQQKGRNYLKIHYQVYVELMNSGVFGNYGCKESVILIGQAAPP